MSIEPRALDFFKQILATPSPAGYESPVQEVVRDYAASFADEMRTDVHGNVIAARNARRPLRVMLAGHCDQIGLVVQYIDDDGFIHVSTIGGWDPQVLIGQRLTVWGIERPRAGNHRPQADPPAERGRAEAGAEDQGPLAGHRREEQGRGPAGRPRGRPDHGGTALPGACKTGGPFRPPWTTRRGCGSSWRPCGGSTAASCKVAAYAVSTVQEEIGLRGAQTSSFSVDPHVGIAVDVTHATDCPTIEKKEEGDIRLGLGPVVYRGPNMNHKVVQRLLDAAHAHEIPYQLGASGRATPTDANSIQVNRAGVAAALVSIPNRYMHSPVEMISLEDIDHAADLLARFLEELPGGRGVYTVNVGWAERKLKSHH